MKTWQNLLERNQIERTNARPVDLGIFWRGLAYQEPTDEAETLVAPALQAAPAMLASARAFQSVLEHLEVDLDGGLVLLSSRCLRSQAYPAGFSQDEIQGLLAACERRGQRDFWAGFDHSLADMPTLLAIGIGGYRKRVEASRHRHKGLKEQAFLSAADWTLAAFSSWIRRIADAAHLAKDPQGEQVCRAIVDDPPSHFREALQLTWLTHLAFKSEGRCHMALGRIDQYLWPFYQQDTESGLLSRAQALELLCHLWARLDEIGEVQNICIGGLTPSDEDATNALSYLCLEATRLVQSPHTNLSARFHDQTPEAFHRACFEVIRTGIGFPAIFNDHVLLEGLEEIGIPLETARDYCMVGCIETMLPGRQPPWSDSRFNTPIYLLSALERLVAEPDPSYARLVALFRGEIGEAIAAHAAQINAHIARFPSEQFPDPFLSALTRDCIGRARDINDGGAEFPRFHGIAVMGLATLADSLAALKKLVFEQGRVGLPELMAALREDFAGCEALRQVLLNKAPKYGTTRLRWTRSPRKLWPGPRRHAWISAWIRAGVSWRRWRPTSRISPRAAR